MEHGPLKYIANDDRFNTNDNPQKNDDGSYKTTNNGTEYVLKSVPNESGTVLPTIGIMVKF